jgi:2-iminobutanoate/2-iminopropanoate deaminase
MQVVTTNRGRGAFGPYSQAVIQNNMLFVSGQLGVDTVSDVMPDDFKEQTNLVFKNIKDILDAAGMGFSNVVKVTIFVTDLANFAVLNELYAQRFAQPYPARETVQVAALPKNAQVEISLIAMR